MDPPCPEPSRPPPPLPSLYRGTLASYSVPAPVKRGLRGRNQHSATSDLSDSPSIVPESLLQYLDSTSTGKDHSPAVSFTPKADNNMIRHRRSNSGDSTGIKVPGPNLNPFHRRSSSWGGGKFGPDSDSAKIVNGQESSNAESPIAYQFAVGSRDGPSVFRSPVASKSPAKHGGRERRRVHFGPTTVLTKAGLPTIAEVVSIHPASTVGVSAGNKVAASMVGLSAGNMVAASTVGVSSGNTTASRPVKKRLVQNDLNKTITTVKPFSFSRVKESVEKSDGRPPAYPGGQEKGEKIKSRRGATLKSGLEAAGRLLLGGRKRTKSSDSKSSDAKRSDAKISDPSMGPLHVPAPSQDENMMRVTVAVEADKNSQNALDTPTGEMVLAQEECHSSPCGASNARETFLESLSCRLLEENAAAAKGASMEFCALGPEGDIGKLPVSSRAIVKSVSEECQEEPRQTLLPKVLKHQSLVALTTNGQLLAATKRNGRWELHGWDGTDLRNASSNKPADIQSGPLPPACMFFLLCPNSKSQLGFRSVAADSMALHAPKSLSLPETFIGWSVRDAELWSVVPMNAKGKSIHLVADGKHYGWDAAEHGLWEGPVILENCRYPERKLHVSVWGLGAGATNVWEQPAAIWAPAGALIPMMHPNVPRDDCKAIVEKDANLSLPASGDLAGTGCTDMAPVLTEEREETQLPACAPPFWPAQPQKTSERLDIVKYEGNQSSPLHKSAAVMLPACLSPLRASPRGINFHMGIPRSPQPFTVVNPFFPTSNNNRNGPSGLGAPPFWPTTSTAVMRSPLHQVLRSPRRSPTDINGDALLHALSPSTNSKAVLFLVKKCQAMEAEVRKLRHLMAKATGIGAVPSSSTSLTSPCSDLSNLILPRSEYEELEENVLAISKHRQAQVSTTEYQQSSPHTPSLPPRHTGRSATRKTQNNSSALLPPRSHAISSSRLSSSSSVRSAFIREERIKKTASFREPTLSSRLVANQVAKTPTTGGGERVSSRGGGASPLNGRLQARIEGGMPQLSRRRGGMVAAAGGASGTGRGNESATANDKIAAVVPLTKAEGLPIWDSPASVKAVWGSPGGSSVGTPEDSLLSILTPSALTTPPLDSPQSWAEGMSEGTEGDIIIDARDLPTWSRQAEEAVARANTEREMNESLSSETSSTSASGGEGGGAANSSPSSLLRTDGHDELQYNSHYDERKDVQEGQQKHIFFGRKEDVGEGCQGGKDMREGLPNGKGLNNQNPVQSSLVDDSARQQRKDVKQGQQHHYLPGRKEEVGEGLQGSSQGKEVHEGLQKTTTVDQGNLEQNSLAGAVTQQQRRRSSGTYSSDRTDGGMVDVINNLTAITSEVKAKTARQRASCAAKLPATSVATAIMEDGGCVPTFCEEGKVLPSSHTTDPPGDGFDDPQLFLDAAEGSAAVQGDASAGNWLQWMTLGGSLEKSKDGDGGRVDREFFDLVERVESPPMRTPPATTWEALFLQRVMGPALQKRNQEKIGSSASTTINKEMQGSYDGSESEDVERHHKEGQKHKGDCCQMLECCHGHTVKPMDILNRGVRFATKGADSPTMSQISEGDSFAGVGGRVAAITGMGKEMVGEVNAKPRTVKRAPGQMDSVGSGDARRSPLNVVNGNVLPQNNASGGRSSQSKKAGQSHQGRSLLAETGLGGTHGGMGGTKSFRQRAVWRSGV